MDFVRHPPTPLWAEVDRAGQGRASPGEASRWLAQSRHSFRKTGELIEILRSGYPATEEFNNTELRLAWRPYSGFAVIRISSIHLAASSGRSTLAEFLLKQGVPVDYTLESAVLAYHIETIKHQLEKNGCFPERKGSSQRTQIFADGFKKAIPEQTDGLHRWKFEAILDPVASVAVTKIIHGKNRDITRTVNSELLAEMAAVIDDLECHDNVGSLPRDGLPV
ncbi:hypothetical protein MRS44_017795 [Fusarium solani]|uniref:uncharacterized protein n=1 Tax=Fusarium solani TaxID=169388 RepID=UPI0032C47EFF|nr:hypothetical protein MRS44_017795 [Fusarium solani]